MNFPTAQSLHDVACTVSWNVPGAHKAHCVDFTALEYVPAAQGMHDDARFWFEKPAGQSLHVVSLFSATPVPERE